MSYGFLQGKSDERVSRQPINSYNETIAGTFMIDLKPILQWVTTNAKSGLSNQSRGSM